MKKIRCEVCGELVGFFDFCEHPNLALLEKPADYIKKLEVSLRRKKAFEIIFRISLGLYFLLAIVDRFSGDFSLGLKTALYIVTVSSGSIVAWGFFRKEMTVLAVSTAVIVFLYVQRLLEMVSQVQLILP